MKYKATPLISTQGSSVLDIMEKCVFNLKRDWGKLRHGSEESLEAKKKIDNAEISYRRTFAAQQLTVITASIRFQVDKSLTYCEHCIGVLIEIERDGNLAPSIVNASEDCAEAVVSTATSGAERGAKNLIGHEEVLAQGAQSLLAELRRYSDFVLMIADVLKHASTAAAEVSSAKKKARRKAA